MSAAPLSMLVEACRGHEWYMVLTPYQGGTAVSIALLDLTEKAHFIATGDTLQGSLDVLWDDVRRWARARAAVGATRAGPSP